MRGFRRDANGERHPLCGEEVSNEGEDLNTTFYGGSCVRAFFGSPSGGSGTKSRGRAKTIGGTKIRNFSKRSAGDDGARRSLGDDRNREPHEA
jgi:hypothetical protein